MTVNTEHHSLVEIQLWLEKATQLAAAHMLLLRKSAHDCNFLETHDGG